MLIWVFTNEANLYRLSTQNTVLNVKLFNFIDEMHYLIIYVRILFIKMQFLYD